MFLVQCPLALHCNFVVGNHRTLTVQQWEDFCLFNQTRADTEIANSVRIREAIHQTMQQTANDLLAQHTATAFALRKRCHEQEMALDELQWQKKQVFPSVYLIISIRFCLSINSSIRSSHQTVIHPPTHSTQSSTLPIVLMSDTCY